VHPAYSPDAAPSDFFLFSYLKSEKTSYTTHSPADILSEIRRISQESLKEILVEGIFCFESNSIRPANGLLFSFGFMTCCKLFDERLRGQSKYQLGFVRLQSGIDLLVFFCPTNAPFPVI
jgi:hypothetical protein